MNTPIPNQIIREITPLSDKDCFYIAERYKTEFTYPIQMMTSVRTVCTTYGLQWGKTFKTRIDREAKTITVTRMK